LKRFRCESATRPSEHRAGDVKPTVMAVDYRDETSIARDESTVFLVLLY